MPRDLEAETNGGWTWTDRKAQGHRRVYSHEGTASMPWVLLLAVISVAITADDPWAGLKVADEMLMRSVKGSTGENRKAVE